ncbi:dockerin type I repeat protein [Acetivibrio thermocellus AD2]|uniref:Dockerin type I repeat protein n=1 Tax=Acetivibrio thermocellus AD2 TaxID=1138384 RepID=A0AB36TI25_ACETH|nr:CotH kinase family protein [Acetivibrio thermocellus]ADU75228.1 Spore coat protein CotH [Acetivibrio thermocellus DSM 1313]ALX09203.1 Spore coat protein CotH [Acetivibrio thermocellus AD2]ANV76955.1 Spore coat protein CotH [Acetivibrio thermocellus DSM 2360]EIC04922.1 Spore coat protein CotH [Acetivibrio thermocellus YS]PFH03478.1 dockerin type I repeat protein [Acetivibrio thermocellus AD2]
MRKFFKLTALTTSMMLLVVCLTGPQVWAASRPEGWTEETHGKKATPNYSVVFPEDKVNRIDIIISPENFQRMENDVFKVFMMSNEDPIYVPATVKFNNHTWWHVGIRYKGQSTLTGAMMSMSHKYPFRLNFDKFEDDYPEIDNQRFYGFDELIFNNNWYDPSFLRDKLTSDIFRDAGIPAPRCAFYRVYVDTGNGPVYWGLYTVFEDPSDKMLEYQFENPNGNLYKGQQAPGGDLTIFDKRGYEKKTNEKADDWSDLQALVAALNAPKTDPAKWRADLEAVFNTDSFLKWLAINTTIVNFDTYGWVTKNHYLYQDLADNGRLVFIPWDYNLSLSSTNPWGIKPPSFSLDEISRNWPLIRNLIDDPVYKHIYHTEIENTLNIYFREFNVIEKARRLHELIRPYTVGSEGEIKGYTYLTNGEAQFNQALTQLIEHISTRHREARSYLSSVNYYTPIPERTPTPFPSPTPKKPKGDINLDGKINSTDLSALKRHILRITTLSGKQLENADVNNDGSVNSTDASILKKYIAKAIPSL